MVSVYKIVIPAWGVHFMSGYLDHPGGSRKHADCGYRLRAGQFPSAGTDTRILIVSASVCCSLGPCTFELHSMHVIQAGIILRGGHLSLYVTWILLLWALLHLLGLHQIVERSSYDPGFMFRLGERNCLLQSPNKYGPNLGINDR